MTAAAGATMRPQLASIQYMRGVAALLVVLFHYRWMLNGDESTLGNHLFGAGYAGVDLFFFISGFIIAHSARAEHGPTRYAVNRISRIAPLYWIATLYVAYRWYDIASIDTLKSLFFIPLSSEKPPFYGYAVLSPGWTLNYEMFFYLVFGVCLFATRRPIAIAALILVCIVGISQFLFTGSVSLKGTDGLVGIPSYLALATNPLVLEFAAGLLAYLIYKRAPRIHPAILALSLIGGLVLFVHFASTSNLRGHGLSQFGFPMLVIFLSAVLLDRDGWVPSFRPGLLLGELSFAVYILHRIVERELVENSPLTGVHLMIVSVGVTLALSYLVHRTIERPAQRRLREFSDHIRQRLSVRRTRSA